MEASPRSDLLTEAIKIVCGDRNVQYGEPTADFQRTADVLNALEFSVSGRDLEPHHIAIIGMVLKLSRITWSPEKYDHWLDIAGYSACGWECNKAQQDGGAVTTPQQTGEARYEPWEVKIDGDGISHYTQLVFVNDEWVEHHFNGNGKLTKTLKRPDYKPDYYVGVE